MTEHVATTEHHDDHEHHDHHDDHDSPEHIRKEVRVYLAVLGGLTVLTAATVGACYGLKLPPHLTIIVALIIASLKGFLVAGFFMHLLSEKKVIYGVLVLTVAFFGILLWLPVHDVLDKFGYK